MATFKVVLWKYFQKEDGTYQVYLRVTHNRKQEYLKLNIFLTEKQFKDGLVKSHLLANEYNSEIKRLLLRANEIVLDFKRRDESLTAKKIVEKLKDKKSRKSFNDFIDEYCQSLTKINTAKKYKTLNKKLREFLKRDLQFEEIDKKFIRRWDKWLHSQRMKNDEPYSINTISKFHANLRAMINKAEEWEEWEFKRYPYKHFHLRTVRGEIKYLSLEDVRKLIKAHLIGEPALIRDYWLAMFYAAGARNDDMLTMEKSNIIGDRLIYVMGKTETTNKKMREVNIPIIEPLAEIIERYKDQSSKYIFPFIPDDLKVGSVEWQKKKEVLRSDINLKLKDLAKHVELSDEGLSTKYARKTMTNILAAAGESTAILKDLLNHANEQITDQHYRDRQNALVDQALIKLNQIVGG